LGQPNDSREESFKMLDFIYILALLNSEMRLSFFLISITVTSQYSQRTIDDEGSQNKSAAQGKGNL
ncbi:hypothetical protein Q6325_28440, partial [Klebsiella pneumoniae]|uniref:hypothetical protein n=1 Tax=Klebsiella pneumoniae TaxID=573 RepID=UPI00272EEA8E